MARGKVCDLVLVTSGGRFNIRRRSLALAGPPISAINRGDALIWDHALEWANALTGSVKVKFSWIYEYSEYSVEYSVYFGNIKFTLGTYQN